MRILLGVKITSKDYQVILQMRQDGVLLVMQNLVCVVSLTSDVNISCGNFGKDLMIKDRSQNLNVKEIQRFFLTKSSKLKSFLSDVSIIARTS